MEEDASVKGYHEDLGDGLNHVVPFVEGVGGPERGAVRSGVLRVFQEDPVTCRGDEEQQVKGEIHQAVVEFDLGLVGLMPCRPCQLWGSDLPRSGGAKPAK